VAVLDRLPVDRIREQAQQIEFARTVLTLVAGVFWLLGWAAARLCAGAWQAVAWAAAAVKVGWADARARAGDG
jgi:hypothetical protein